MKDIAIKVVKISPFFSPSASSFSSSLSSLFLKWFLNFS